MVRGATHQQLQALAKDLPPRDRDRGALKQSVANQSAAEEHHPSSIMQNKTRSVQATQAIWVTCIQNKRASEVG